MLSFPGSWRRPAALPLAPLLPFRFLRYQTFDNEMYALKNHDRVIRVLQLRVIEQRETLEG
jgi:hypothetical protein